LLEIVGMLPYAFWKKAPTGLARLQQPLPVRKKNVSNEINL
jgi:hypothetical protein